MAAEDTMVVAGIMAVDITVIIMEITMEGIMADTMVDMVTAVGTATVAMALVLRQEYSQVLLLPAQQLLQGQQAQQAQLHPMHVIRQIAQHNRLMKPTVPLIDHMMMKTTTMTKNIMMMKTMKMINKSLHPSQKRRANNGALFLYKELLYSPYCPTLKS
jgi:hypothetical protein